MNKKEKILIIEDAYIIAIDIKMALLRENYEIADIISRGEEAYNKIDDLNPDLILMDIQLKGEWNGIKTSNEISNKYNIPIIYITANSNISTFKKAILTENYGILEKPINYLRLYTTIELALFRHKHDQKIKEQQQWLNMTLKSIGEGIIAIDTNWNIKFINNEALWMINKTEKEVIGKPFDRIMTDILKEQSIKDIITNLKNKKMDSSGLYTYSCYNQTGNLNLILETTYSLIQDTFNNLIGVVCNLRNVTLQKMRDEELLKLSNIVEIMEETVVITDKNGIIEYVNTAFENVTGWTKHEVSGKKPSILKSGSHSNKMYSKMWNTITNKMRWSGRVVNHKKNKIHYHCALTIIPVTDKNNEIIRFVGVGKDITDEIHSQIKLVNMHRMTALATLSGAVAHEINQPLSGIRVYTQILVEEAKEKKESLIPDVIELGDKIEKQITRINGIINHLKLFAKDDNKISTNKININKLIKETLDLVGSQLKSRGIQVLLNISKEINIYSDKIKLEQVIINILTNAKNAFEDYDITEKKIIIETQYSEKNAKIIIRISDNGPGIPENYIENLFEPFVTSKSNDGVSGLGLGLSICRDIMKQLNGEIILEKTSNEGTTFLLKFNAL